MMANHQETELLRVVKGAEERLNVAEAAKYVGCSTDYIYKQSAAGKLAHYKIAGRLKFKRSDLDAFIEQHRQGERH